MHVSQAILLCVAAVTGVQAFTIPFAPRSTSALNAMSSKQVRSTLNELTADNFSASLATLEPFLLNDAGSTQYTKTLKRIQARAKGVGAAVPSGYAKEAKATTKKRAQQVEYIAAAAEKEAEKAAEAVAAAAAETVADEPAEAPKEE
jgi:hypothetical protein